MWRFAPLKLICKPQINIEKKTNNNNNINNNAVVAFTVTKLCKATQCRQEQHTALFFKFWRKQHNHNLQYMFHKCSERRENTVN